MGIFNRKKEKDEEHVVDKNIDYLDVRAITCNVCRGSKKEETYSEAYDNQTFNIKPGPRPKLRAFNPHRGADANGNMTGNIDEVLAWEERVRMSGNPGMTSFTTTCRRCEGTGKIRVSISELNELHKQVQNGLPKLNEIVDVGLFGLQKDSILKKLDRIQSKEEVEKIKEVSLRSTEFSKRMTSVTYLATLDEKKEMDKIHGELQAAFEAKASIIGAKYRSVQIANPIILQNFERRKEKLIGKINLIASKEDILREEVNRESIQIAKELSSYGWLNSEDDRILKQIEEAFAAKASQLGLKVQRRSLD